MMINGNRFETYFSPFPFPTFNHFWVILTILFFLRASLSIKGRCNTTSASDTKNFVLLIGFSGNRCIFASMLRCTSLAHPCASVARFSPKFQVPLADFCYASSFNGPAGTGSKIIIVLIIALISLWFIRFGDWEMGKCGLLLCLEVLHGSSECGYLMKIVRGS